MKYEFIDNLKHKTTFKKKIALVLVRIYIDKTYNLSHIKVNDNWTINDNLL